MTFILRTITQLKKISIFCSISLLILIIYKICYLVFYDSLIDLEKISICVVAIKLVGQLVILSQVVLVLNTFKNERLGDKKRIVSLPKFLYPISVIQLFLSVLEIELTRRIIEDTSSQMTIYQNIELLVKFIILIIIILISIDYFIWSKKIHLALKTQEDEYFRPRQYTGPI